MIKLKNVGYVYMQGGPFEKTALEDINLEISEGEFIGLIGHTGSGKSTLIQLLNGLLKPTSGTISIGGRVLGQKGTDMRALRFDVGLVMQYPEYQLFEETVAKDIAFGPSNMGLDPKEIEERVAFAANMVGLKKELLSKSPFDLSGGQKRRAAIAGVLAMEPKVLILDEPTAGLDPAGRDEILFKIKDMHERMNMTVILVSHSMEDIAKLADRILVMNHGRVEMFGTTDAVFQQGQRLSEIGLNVPQITRIMDGLKQKGLPVPGGIYTVEDALRVLIPILKPEGNPLC
ncbi:energy-coupling factor transporter ATPase [Ructibacterium gallinarum]|uniref:Energy-coupling factor transporter ATP-binding protein EcfA2 n=1 Tax=Ructibacterium gallinarum TaxID=2779355 RepID=A0A9D5M0F2_9FIRM|nr:energy-coupling factor transporter ATPase [Ructibacterium gallinarum]MBE5039861.1 energy-coupling factor transporter ATPase [Ructibacterium gallinarum]